MKDLSILNQFQGFLNTPDIFSQEYQGDFKSFYFPQIIITEDLIKDLKELDHPRNSVLGKRMESFFEIALKYSDRYELIASNIQIIANKQTLGEMDFLVFDKLNLKVLHIELVYKLYLHDPSFTNELQKWIGPNLRDSFAEKLEKLSYRQFPLLYKHETFSYLNKLGINPEDIEQQLCFKAQLFIPGNRDIEKHEIINLDCIKGNWYILDDFLRKKWQENLFFSPKKKDWSCDPQNNSNWISREELLREIEVLFKKKKAPLIWMKTESGFHRFFIVWW